MNTPDNVKPVSPGDIFCYSWGYDQTNVDFYQVIRCTPKSAVLRRIGQEEVPGTNNGGMSCKVRPVPNYFANEVLTKRIKFYGSEAFVRMDHGNATRTNPETPHYCSWYA